MSDQSDEKRRLDTLHRYRILDSEPEVAFDSLVDLLVSSCDMPAAIVSFLDADRQWFKAVHGLGLSFTSRKVAFCNHTIAQADYLCIPDTLEDPRFSTNPLVVEQPGIRFYAGSPILAEDGACVGTVAVLDFRPRQATSNLESTLKAAARLASHAMQIRLQQLLLEDSLTEQVRLSETLEHKERQLDESRFLMEMAGRAARFGGWRVDLKSNLITWSQVVADIHEEPRGKSPTLEQGIGYYAPEHRDRIRAVFNRCVERGETFDGEFRIITARGGSVWVRTLGMAVRDGKGNVIAVQGAFQDISARKEQEERLHVSEERYRHVAEASQAALWDYDMVSDTVNYSDSFRELMGAPRDAELPEGLDGYLRGIHPDDQERVRKEIEKLIDPDSPDLTSVEFRVRVWSGEYRWMQTNVKLLRDENGNPLRRLGSTLDIHDRKLSEERIRHLADRLSSTLESITDAVFSVDSKFNLIYMNSEAERVLGRKKKEILGTNLWEAFPGAREERFGTEYHRAMSEGKAVSFESFHEPLDAWFSVRAFPSDDGLVVYFQDITRRKVSERKLSEAVERMRAILSVARDSIITINEQGVIESVNPGTIEMFGYDKQDLVGRRINMLMPEELAEHHDNFLDRYLTTGQTRIIGKSQKMTARRSDGSNFPVELTVSEVNLSSGRIFTGFLRDLSFEEQARRELEESEERFKGVARSTTDVIWDYDLKSGETWWSSGIEEVFGYAPGDLASDIDTWIQAIHPDDRERVEKGLDAAIRNRAEVWVEEYRMRRKNGEYAIVADSGALIADPDGEPLRMVGGIRDITEQRSVEVKVAEQADLLDKARDAIMVLDMDHRIQFWNRGAESLYGWPAEEVIGRRPADFLDSGPGRNESIPDAGWLDGQWSGKLVHSTRQGKEIRVESSWSLVFDEMGNPKSILVINTDITDRLVLEQQLQHSRRLESIGQLTGGIAHDFNNLLTVILGNAELLSEQLKDSAGLRRLAEMSRSAAERGAELTNRLLAFARKQTLEPRPVDIRMLVDGMEPLLKRTLSDEIELEIIHADDALHAEVDTVQLESSLLNLVINSRDAMPDGGKVMLETRNVVLDADYTRFHEGLDAGWFVLVSVTDTGTGIEPENMEHLFEPFFTTKPQGKGTGLGLPMVYGFVKQSGGHVSVYSEPGLGTTVHLYLPVTQREVGSVEPPGSAEQVRGRGEQILVVEDDSLVREHAVRVLKGLGYKVGSAENAHAALEELRLGNRYDLLFTDVIMPGGIKGPELAKDAVRIQPDLRVLFTSGYTRNAILDQDGLEAGMALLQKPYSREELARKIRLAMNADDTGTTGKA